MPPIPRSLARFMDAPSDAHARSGSEIFDQSSEVGMLLIAPGSRSCRLPLTTDFEPLNPPEDRIPVSNSMFDAHYRYLIPRDRHVQIHGAAHSAADMVHHLTVMHPRCDHLNKQLMQFALLTEEQTVGLDVGKSNHGGFQSEPLLFFDSNHSDVGVGDDQAANHQSATLSRAAIASLHEVVSLALDEVQLPGVAAASSSTLQQGIVWLNINRGTDSNMMHVHTPGRWSGVYFVASGEASGLVEGSSTAASTNIMAELAGHLVFRGGGKSAAATHTFFAVAPRPGSLYLFPGSVPHCVFPCDFGSAPGAGDAIAHSELQAETRNEGCERNGRIPRVSFAFNLESGC